MPRAEVMSDLSGSDDEIEAGAAGATLRLWHARSLMSCRAAPRITDGLAASLLLSFRQADGKPPGSVEDRERAEHDKEDRFVHVWINVAQGGAGNVIKRRGELIFV
jgi:hypothetical protein